MAGIAFESVSKRFDDGTMAVADLTLGVEDGEFMVLVGPSGSGKTTAMRMVAGLEEATAGTIRIGNRVVNDLPPRDRKVGMVFQNYALYPHLTVGDNMAFPLKLAGAPKPERKKRVDRAAEMLGISDLLHRKPRQLSGGQRQRVAMGRAIVRDAEAFLMDEPLSNLDAKLRVEMRAYIASLHQEVRTTTLYVTHDQSEAMTMGDRVALMRNGRFEQVDAPTVLYERPRNLFVAGFVGSPAMNLLPCRLEAEDDGLVAVAGGARLRLPASLLNARGALRTYAGRDVVLGVRPEDFEDAAFAHAGVEGQLVDVLVRLVEPMGSETIVHFDVLGDDSPGSADGAPRMGRFVGRLNPRTRTTRGTPLALSVDVGRLHFFDADTELAIGLPA